MDIGSQARAHPIRLVIGDDLRRSRLTVFFRLLLAIPHLLWATVWGVAAAGAGVASFFVTLAVGRTPAALHRFLAAYVRYVVHVYAYLHLAADPYPGFTGSAGSYPVDVEIDPPARQSRLKVAFRLVLAAPALLLVLVLLGSGSGQESGGFTLGVLGTIALLAWFACLATGTMPRGFRDLLAYALRYLAQATAYVLLLTDRYPDSDTRLPVDAPADEHPVALRAVDDGSRSRLAVLFRGLLVLPHVVWVVLWSALVLVALPAHWLTLLLIGRPLGPLHRFLAAYLRYTTHLQAFAYLVGGPFPGFTGERYTVSVTLPAPARQARWKTALRLLLVVPAAAVSASLASLLVLVAVFGWFVSLVLGRMPGGLCRLGAYVLRYNAQVAAYGSLLLTDRYPHSSPAADRRDVAPSAAAGPARAL